MFPPANEALRAVRPGPWVLLLSLLAGWPPLATALPGDREQPIRITADSALRDEKQGFTIYTGSVQLKQGSLQIEAERLTVYHQVEAADRIVAEGNPAHLQEQPEADQRLLHARARVIEYFNSEERVQLRRDASIEQGGSLVTGNSIDYFIAEQRVRANSDGDSGNGRRVEVVIPARVAEDKPPEDNDPGEDAGGAAEGE